MEPRDSAQDKGVCSNGACYIQSQMSSHVVAISVVIMLVTVQDTGYTTSLLPDTYPAAQESPITL